MARERFCPKCGGPIQEGRLCDNCTQKSVEYTPPRVQVSEFGRSFEKGRWVRFYDIDDLLIRKVKEALGKDIPIELEPFEFIPAPKTKTIVKAHATIEGKDVELPIKLSYRQCDFGQKQKTGYYEGILQVQRPHDEVMKYIERDLAKVADKGIFITKTAPTKLGVDLYFTNKNYLRILGQRIVNRFGGELVLNPQLFTRNHLTSKDVYRLNALIRLPEFKKGDIISYKPDKVRVKDAGIVVVKVTSMGKLIKARDVVSGNPIAFELKYVKDIKILSTKKTTISSVHPTIAIIDPDNFQEMEVLNENLHKDYEEGQEVEAVKTPYGPLIVED